MKQEKTRVFPQALEAEQTLLGSCVLDPTILDWLPGELMPAHMYRADHRALYTLLLEMRSKGEHIDVVTVPERMTRSGNDEEYGGLRYVLTLVEHVPSTANAETYAGIIREKYDLRQLIARAHEVEAEVHRGVQSASDIRDGVVADLLRAGTRVVGRGWVPAETAVDELLADIEGADPEKPPGLNTGFQAIDEMLDGLLAGDLVVLGARPAMGKTSLALAIAQHVATSRGPVAFFSLEMPRKQLIARQMSWLTHIGLTALLRRRFGEDRWGDVYDAADKCKAVPIHIDDQAGLTMPQIVGRARSFAAQHPDLQMLVLDYLQLVVATDERIPREQHISQVAYACKQLAKDLGIPVLALAQVGRSVEDRPNKRPLPSDLRESGGIEAAADKILFIYRHDFYYRDCKSEDKGFAEVEIAKARNGGTGRVLLDFDAPLARFRNLTRAFPPYYSKAK